VDADGVYEVQWKQENNAIALEDAISRVGIYVAAPDAALRNYLEDKRQKLIEAEQSLQFDPACRDEDFAELETLLKSLK
jgi:hypothetical protein